MNLSDGRLSNCLFRRRHAPKPLLFRPEKRDPAYLSSGFSSTYSWSSQRALRVQALLNLLLSHCSKLIELQGIFPSCKRQFKTYTTLNLVYILQLSLHHPVTKSQEKNVGSRYAKKPF
ncbi:hypothetical protein AVEN_52509-1 [Araneus ventricosus]|uniref:Uncharacterized protein n=1 Tax=Araneus ventricosus TaxID=182803 RepID=A0A4Y2SRI8_ARAVE|nr:hypothetical protein AVEN_52509-1 [Araneus ventricosus]